MRLINKFKSDLAKLSTGAFLARYVLPVVLLIMLGTGVNSLITYDTVDEMKCYEGKINFVSFSTYTIEVKRGRTWENEKHCSAKVSLNTGSYFSVTDQECPDCFYKTTFSEGDECAFCEEEETSDILRIEKNGDLLLDWHKDEEKSASKVIFVIIAIVFLTYIYFRFKSA
ncbi:MAG TPA: hypothetical protein VK177_06400 [Flavobacteriales bacterium]|nr:hypothetical protein [Flavobacteriales bacterium]